MEISVIASGSNGNCCLIEDKSLFLQKKKPVDKRSSIQKKKHYHYSLGYSQKRKIRKNQLTNQH